MRKTELIVSGEVICPKTKASIVAHEHTNVEALLDQQNRTSSTITQSASTSKVGLGDGEDLSFCVEDGFYESATLYGKSMVNCIQEPSEPSYVALGENLEFQNKKVEYTTDGQIKSAMLNGQTLVNLNNGERSKTLDSTTGTGVARTYACNIPYKIPSATYLTFKLKTNTTNGITGNLKVHFKQNLSNSSDGDQYCTLRNYTTHPTGDYYVNICYQTTIDIEGLSIYIDNNKGVIDISDVIILIGDHTQEDIPYFEGMQSVTMTTELENVCSRHNSSLAKSGTTFTVGTSSNSRSLQLSDSSNISKYNFKPNTKYLVQFKVTNLNLDGLDYITLVFSSSSVASGNSLFGDKTDLPITKNGIYRTVLTTSNVISTSDFVIKGTKIQWEDSTSTTRKLTISQIMCIEYQNGMENWDLPYFEATQLMKPLKVRTMSKNLCPVGKGQFFNCFFKAGTQFTLSTKDGVASNGGNIVFKDKDGNSMWLGINSGTSLARTTLAKDAYQIVNQLNSEVIQYQLEEGSTSTDYVPHQSKITSALEPITLRAIGNVKDTLDLSTGEYVQRIGEVVLDGDNGGYWALNQTITAGYQYTWRADPINLSNTTTIVLCDRLSYSTAHSLVDVIWVYNGTHIVIHSTIDNLTDFKIWLASNPLKIQYILANPITRKILIEYPNLQTYQDITHVQSIAMDGTLIPKIFLPSDISYKAMLKPNTSYNVVVDREVIDSTNQLTVNLGGTTATTTVGNRVTTITTPSTLSNELLTMSGRGNKLSNVMVIEGEVVGDEPYFEGICDCKSPTLSNVGKNLISSFTESSSIQATTGNVVEMDEWIANDEFIRVKKNTPYTISLTGDMGMINGGWVYVYPYDFNKKFLGRDERKDLGRTNKTFMFDYDCFVKFTCKVKNVTSLQLEEGSISTSYEPYKSNILSCNGDKIELTEDMFEQGTVSGACGVGSKYGTMKENSTVRLRSKDIIKVKPNTNYRLFRENGYDGWCVAFDSNQTYLGKSYQTETFTTDSQTHYIVPVLKKTDNSTMVLSALSNFTLSEVDKTIVLRSLPNGVCDTLNVETGEYVQRIGEGVFNGSENWLLENFVHDTLIEFKLASDYRVKSNNSLICDGFAPKLQNNVERIYMFANGLVYVRILKTKVASVGDFKQYLKTNPLTIQYELETPIVKTVDLSGFPFSYENGHVILSSGSIEQSLTPKVEYVVQTNRAGAIQANQDRLLNHDKRLAMLEDLVLHQLIQLEYNRAKCTFLSQTRQIFEGGIQMYHTKYELLSEFIEKKLYRSLEEVFEMLDVYFMLGDITDGEYDALYEALIPSAEEIFEVEETFDHEDVEV